jgi:dimethylsulfone monooxygenase
MIGMSGRPASDRADAKPWAGEDFAIGLFGYLHSGGNAFTTVPERWRARWNDIVAMAGIADRGGLDFLLPIARWSGVRSAVDNRLHSFETLTHAAALAGHTRRVRLFSTVHTPMVHPVFAAKAMATIDHASAGRSGINIVCGWNDEDFAMFGLSAQPHDQRYAQGMEWYDIWSRLVSGEPAPFDHDGRFFPGLRGLHGMPGSVRRPRPTILSAAHSPEGRDFAARVSDFLLAPLLSLDEGRTEVRAFQRRAEGFGRETPPGVLTVAYVVCRESRAAAEDFHSYFAERNADTAAIDHWLTSRRKNAMLPEALYAEKLRMAAGNGAYPLIGSPEDVAAGIRAIQDAGFAGVGLTFLNFLDELPLFVERVLPLLRRDAPPAVAAGRRHARAT